MRQVLPIVGMAIGGMVGGPIGAQVGGMIGGIVGGIVDPQIIKGPDIGEGQQTTSNEGTPRPRVWGLGCVGGNVIARGPLVKSIKKEKQGKGGPVTKTEQFHMTYAISVCAHKIDGILRIWEDETLVYDVRADGNKQVEDEENEEYKKNFKLYLGTEDQLPDSDLEAVYGVGDTPAYIGTAYLVFPKRNLTARNGSIPNYRFEVSNSGMFISYPDFLDGNGNFYTLEKSTGKLLFSHEAGAEFGGNVSFSKDGQYCIALKYVNGRPNQPIIYRLNIENGKYDIKVFEGESGGNDNTNLVFNPRYNVLFYHRKRNGGELEIYKASEDGYSFILVNTVSYNVNFAGNLQRAYFAEDGVKVIFRDLNAYDYICFNYNYYNNSINTVKKSSNFNNIANAASIQNDLVIKNNILYSIVGNGNNACMRFSRINEDNSITLINDSSSFGEFATRQIILTANKAGFITSYKTTNVDNTYVQKLCVLQIIPNEAITNGFDVRKIDLEQPTKLPFLSASNTSQYFKNDYFIITTTENYGGPSEFLATYKITDGGAILISEQENLFNNDTDRFTTTHIHSTVNGGSAFTSNWLVADIIRDIADILKIDNDIINTVDIEDLECRGLVSAQQYTAGNIIRTLQNSYIFDISEYDEKMNFKARGSDVVESISFNMLINESYEFKRKSSIEYPRKVELIYQNPVVGYSTAKAFAERISPNVNVSGSQTQTVPVTMLEDEAAKLVDKMHKIAWAEAEGEVELSLPSSYAHLTVSDCIGFFTDSDSNLNQKSVAKRLRIEKIQTADGIINLSCKVDRQTAYKSNATGIPVPIPTPPAPTIVGNTVFAYLDIPALIDTQDKLGYYVAGTGTTSAWYGAEVQKMSTTNDFESVTNIGMGDVVGILLNDVTSASEDYIDNNNKITVQLYHEYDVPESVTIEQLLQENNAFALSRVDGSAEILQFKDAVDKGNMIYELSYLIRGRLNSKATSHSAGAKFVLLKDAQFINETATVLNTVLQHRAVSFGQTPETATVYNDNFVGRSQIEFPVYDLQAKIDGVNSEITWIPRERFGTDLIPIRSQNWTNYKVILSDGNLTKEVTTLEPFIDFNAQEYSDNLSVTVYQVNRITGLGEPVNLTVEL